MKNFKLLIPMWPSKKSLSDKIGAGSRYKDFTGTDSFYIPFRAINPESYPNSLTYRDWNDIGILVFMSLDSGITLQINAHNVRSADTAYLEILLKTLKWANKKISSLQLKNIKLENLPFVLVDFVNALGIKECVQYKPFEKDNFVPVSEVLSIINTEIHNSFKSLKKST